MNIEIITQLNTFIMYFILGILIGLFFDLFRILRKTFKTPDFITYIEDILFGFITGAVLLWIIFVFNNGELRFYMFFALILGSILYLITLSKYFIKINVKIFVILKNTIYKFLSILIFPIKWLTKQIISNNCLKLKKKTNITNKKEDFRK